MKKETIENIIDKLSMNAWYGKKPTTAFIIGDNNVFRLEGEVYENGYESYSAFCSVYLNNEKLYRQNSHCTGAYKIETYHEGKFNNYDDIVRYIEETTKNKNYKIQYIEPKNMNRKKNNKEKER